MHNDFSLKGFKAADEDPQKQSAVRNQFPTLPYVLISGSYKENDDNDVLCKMLGSYLSKYHIGVISGAGKSGLMVSHSLSSNLVAESKYDPDKIIFYLRMKEKLPKTCVDSIGTVKFYGNQPLEMRQEMVSKVLAVIVIGGKSGTKQEQQLAGINCIPIIPIARTGGTAYDSWEKQMRKFESSFIRMQPFDIETFEMLNNKNIHFAVKAAISLLKKFSWFSKSYHK